MLFKKITHGYVEQYFNDRGECVKQEFTAGCSSDDVTYETDEGDEINMADMPYNGNEYFPFDMRQPQDEFYKEG